MHIVPRSRACLAVLASFSFMAMIATPLSAAPPLSGAIFTTTVDGAIVNENVHYAAKEDVYLDGGPGPHAPSTAAGLPEGDYYFQVTDPSGKDLLSTDHISCRKIHVNEYGVIDQVYSGTNYYYSNPDHAWMSVPCQHQQGIDVDHSELGAITVQLFPYDDTPNNGGVYKAWVTPVADYTGDPNFVPVDKKDSVNGENYQPGDYHGFVPASSKTDNYKVKKKGPPYVSPVISVRKFHDANLNSVWDYGEEEVTGWAVQVTDPLGVTNTFYTLASIAAEPSGTWKLVESTPTGTLQTAGYLDNDLKSGWPTADPQILVDVAGDSGETHEAIYGNVGLGKITATKIFDQNGNGVADTGEPGIPGWKVKLTGTDATGSAVNAIQITDGNGIATFDNLLPGTYTVMEIIPTTGNWTATGAVSTDVTITSSLNGDTLAGTQASVVFTNVCYGTADFDTKGYWHNKNGLTEMTDTDIDHVNGLDPYDSPTEYFAAGDEPFDGQFENGDPVAAAHGDWGEVIAPEGSARAEISYFLVESIEGNTRAQLAEQLLAFIFNTRHRLAGGDGTIQLPDMTWTSASGLIEEAIGIWQSGTDAEKNDMSNLLDQLNNSDAIPYIPAYACPVVYP